MQWTVQQDQALSLSGAWLRIRYKPFFYLAGYAGTGKTSLAKHLAKHVSGKVAFAAFTGKAASVMRRAGCKDATTIHDLIYFTEVDRKGRVKIYLKSPADLGDVKLIVIDECSMVDQEMGQHLLSFGIPVLVLGDPFQLPPVRGAGFFTVGEPDFLLTDVHRHAGPILHLATEVREGRFTHRPLEEDGLVMCPKAELDPELVYRANAVVVGRNDTRRRFTARLREVKGIYGDPQVGEPVICLRNDKKLQIVNGESFEVTSITDATNLWKVGVKGYRNKARDVQVLKGFFQDDERAKRLPFEDLRGTQQFTFAYALTCHKLQGSQEDEICVFDESDAFKEHALKWQYTAMTRAAKHLTFVY